MRRERELGAESPNVSTAASNDSSSSSGGIRGIKEFLCEFDGSDNIFLNWKQQLELLMRVYNLDDNSTKVLISSRLKGRTLNWFHSKAEHLALSIPDLLRDMQQMFDFRSAKLALRKEFEARM